MARDVDWANPTDEDLAWAVEWEQWARIREAGYDLDEVAARYGAALPEGMQDPYGTAGVPRTGADNEMRINPKTGRPETVGTAEEADPGEPEEADDGMPEDWNDWKVADLREECLRRQLPADGNKADLVARLVEDDENEADDE